MASSKTISKALLIIQVSYPSMVNKFPTEAVEVWAKLFQDVDDETFKKGLSRAVKTNEFISVYAIENSIKSVLLDDWPDSVVWSAFEREMRTLQKYRDNFGNSEPTESGVTKGTAAKLAAKKYFNELPRIIKEFIGDYLSVFDTLNLMNSPVEKCRVKTSFFCYFNAIKKEKTATELRNLLNELKDFTQRKEASSNDC